MYPIYALANYWMWRNIVSEIVNAKPLQTEEEAQLMLAKLGEMTVAISEVRKRLNRYILISNGFIPISNRCILSLIGAF